MIVILLLSLYKKCKVLFDNHGLVSFMYIIAVNHKGCLSKLCLMIPLNKNMFGFFLYRMVNRRETRNIPIIPESSGFVSHNPNQESLPNLSNGK